MSRRRKSDIAVLIVGLVILVGLAFALRPQHTPVTAATAQTDEKPRPASSRPKDFMPTALFIGDSYTAGDGLKETSPGCMAAVRMGWLCQLSAVPGTGYISGGPSNRFIVDEYIGSSTSMSERIPGLALTYQPDIVILDGGRNDTFPPPEDVFNAMAATIADARHAWPNAKLVFVRPRMLANPDDDLGFDDEFISRLSTQPGAEGMVVIDPIRFFTGSDTSGMLSDDQIHPNQRGEQQLASALVQSFVNHGFAVGS